MSAFDTFWSNPDNLAYFLSIVPTPDDTPLPVPPNPNELETWADLIEGERYCHACGGTGTEPRTVGAAAVACTRCNGTGSIVDFHPLIDQE
jgi:hypothetical protein